MSTARLQCLGSLLLEEQPALVTLTDAGIYRAMAKHQHLVLSVNFKIRPSLALPCSSLRQDILAG
jgi:hypothetical protein